MLVALSSRRRAMGISRDNWHKLRKTGAKRKPHRQKRNSEPGRLLPTLRWDPAAHARLERGRQQPGPSLEAGGGQLLGLRVLDALKEDY